MTIARLYQFWHALPTNPIPIREDGAYCMNYGLLCRMSGLVCWKRYPLGRDLLAFATVQSEFAEIGLSAGGFAGIDLSANVFVGFRLSAVGFAEIWYSARHVPALWPIPANPFAL